MPEGAGNEMSAMEDERRPVTVLFADIVGSTGLGERLEPEQAKVLVGECVTMMSRSVEEYGGTIQAYQGDGVCAYFGVPTAHEDDPERAARAGLRILELVGEYSREIEEAWGISGFAVRVGINSGPAAVGLVGAAVPQTVALGDTTNVAARLQAAAEPGSIVVGPAAARSLAGRFVLEPAADVSVKGREEPVSASLLLRAKEREPRERSTPLVGRERELDELRGVIDDLLAGRGSVILLTGAPGIGKTRLLTELASLTGDRVTWLEGRCHSYGGLPRWPLVEALLGWLGADIGEPEIAIRTKLRAGLGNLFGSEVDDLLAPLAALLRLRLEPDAVVAAASTEHAYVRWIEAADGRSAGRPRHRGHAVGRRADARARPAAPRADRPCASGDSPHGGADRRLRGRRVYGSTHSAGSATGRGSSPWALSRTTRPGRSSRAGSAIGSTTRRARGS